MNDELKTENGNGLPPSRQAAVVQAAEYLQEVAHARDLAQYEVSKLKSDVTSYKIALEAKDSIIAELESRMESIRIRCDDLVSQREKYLAVCMSINALMLTFEIPAKPLVRDTKEVEHSQDYLDQLHSRSLDG